MTEEELRRCVLKVVSPYEGSAFAAGPDRAVSCVHVCVRDGARADRRHRVEFEYRPPGATKPVTFHGNYLPKESDPGHDIAVIELAIPKGVTIPAAPLSRDDYGEEEVVALGFPRGQHALQDVAGAIITQHRTRDVTFEDGATLSVLHIDTRGVRGFWADGVVRPAMSGGPILNVRTGTVVAIVEGKRPRGSLDSPPEGYGIQLEHLARCSASLKDRIQARAGDGSSPPPVSPAYREWLMRRCAGVELLGLRLRHGQAVRLGNVYVPLTTLRAEAEPGRSLRGSSRDREEIVERDRQPPALLLHRLGESSLYVPGDPGSGKSTFCRWVAWLACHGVMPTPDVELPEELRERLPVSLTARLPLLIPLREFWPDLPAGDRARGMGRRDLEATIERWIDRKDPDGLTGAEARAHFERGSVLLILDGIDEVPLAARGVLLAALADAIPAWHRRGHRLLVTSRPYGLEPGEVVRLSLPTATIEPLREALQDLLVRRWFRILADSEAEGDETAGELRRQIARQDWLRDLAGNPLLLTALCIVYGQGKRLPEDRHELYEEIVNTVLHSHIDVPGQRDLVKGRLAAVAHGMHTGAGLGEGRTTPQAEVTDDEIDRILRAWREWAAWTERHARSLWEDRQEILGLTGLLLPRGDHRASFYHFSIQEFFAAAHLIAVTEDQPRLVELYVERGAHPEWRSTLGFLFGGLVRRSVRPERPVRLLTGLLDALEPGGIGLQVVVADAFEILLRRGFSPSPEAEDRLRRIWRDAMRSAAPARDRCRLDDALALLGDPRFRADAYYLPDEPMLGFVEVPAGPFRMGSDPEMDREARPDEQAMHDVSLPAFYIALFPVTVAQFKAFVEDSGFGPGDRDCLRGIANHPVRRVSWHEAIAYCRWLTKKLRERDGTPEPLRALLNSGGSRQRWAVTLASEAEWEKAAHGTDGRIYPWGDTADPDRANCVDTGIGATNAVGCFSSGASPYGVEDLSGDVVEWTRSLEKPYPYDGADGWELLDASGRRVVRGGGFHDFAGFARCAFRCGFDPGNRLGLIGFRVVVSPFASEL